jgi:hypothetical protein
MSLNPISIAPFAFVFVEVRGQAFGEWRFERKGVEGPAEIALPKHVLFRLVRHGGDEDASRAENAHGF